MARHSMQAAAAELDASMRGQAASEEAVCWLAAGSDSAWQHALACSKDDAGSVNHFRSVLARVTSHEQVTREEADSRALQATVCRLLDMGRPLLAWRSCINKGLQNQSTGARWSGRAQEKALLHALTGHAKSNLAKPEVCASVLVTLTLLGAHSEAWEVKAALAVAQGCAPGAMIPLLPAGREVSRCLQSLAASGSWADFLANASFAPLSEVIRIACWAFPSRSLSHHVLHILHQAQRLDISSAEDAQSFPDLMTAVIPKFQVNQGEQLAQRAISQRWPVLAVLATCSHSPVDSTTAFSAWLHATLPAACIAASTDASDASTASNPIPSADPGCLQRLIAHACTCGRHDDVMQGCQLFKRNLPLESFVTFIQAYAWGQYSAMDAHLQQAGQQLYDSCMATTPRSTDAGSPDSNLTWALQTWWAIAEASLQHAATFCDRLALLRRLVTIDVPLREGNGNLRFRALKVAYELLGDTAQPCLQWQAGRHWVDAPAVLKLLLYQERWHDARRWARLTDQPQEAVTKAMQRTMHLLKMLSRRLDLKQDADMLPARDSLPPVPEAGQHQDHRQAFWRLLQDKVVQLAPRLPPEHLQAAVHLALEDGDLVLARTLSLELASPPIELALALLQLRAARVLGLSPAQVAGLPPSDALLLLLSATAEACQVAQEWKACWQIGDASVATITAQAYLKGLLAAHHSGVVTAGMGMCNLKHFTTFTQELQDASLVGNALLRLLLERHAALPAQVEADIMLRVHWCYAASACEQGTAALVQVAAASLPRLHAAGELKALAALAAGLGKFKAVRRAMDLLAGEQGIELLLARDNRLATAPGAPGKQLSQLAVLAALQKNPKSKELVPLAHHFFTLPRRMAASQLSKEAQRTTADAMGKPRKASDASSASPERITALLRAADSLVAAQCSRQAAECAQLAAQLAQELYTG
ncbi:hypothetical protein WJX73_001136 [Symbiochloris irregularis]|uniref:Spatacsin C-terminal domain-containing protein n=1 Tax=Symbiochloris irregularis TaxID=706552 RepID=A0AAW1NPW3_9CHLO